MIEWLIDLWIRRSKSRSGRSAIADSSRALLTPSLGAETANTTEKCIAGSGVPRSTYTCDTPGLPYRYRYPERLLYPAIHEYKGCT
ncbi:MAG: hypothetical protein RMJ00_06870 [Nitrososphaerota archaeon]|nr:hypothetical protein [Candidatus Bathyarchaeota archaeon]MDW8062404.1 hypothetical protein [Nitrososphaerota archaeon]